MTSRSDMGKSKDIFTQVRQSEIDKELTKDRLPDFYIDQQITKQLKEKKNENPESNHQGL